MNSIFALVWALGSSTALAETGATLGASTEQFATESGQEVRLEAKFGHTSESQIRTRLPKFEFEYRGFYEFSKQGDSSNEIDRLAGRFGTENLFFSVGRIKPWNEAEPKLDSGIHGRSALGSAWSQNQSDVFDPRVQGWFGFGLASGAQTSSVRGALVFSPFFLPNFGTRLKLSESEAVSGSRYSTLPPSSAVISGGMFPIRYTLITKDVSQIVLQPQIAATVATDSSLGLFGATVWSAPVGDPTVSPDPFLDVSGSEPIVRVLTRADFEREQGFAFQFRAQHLWSRPEFQIVRGMNRNTWSFSSELHPLRGTGIGYLKSPTLFGSDLLYVRFETPEDSIGPWRHGLVFDRHFAEAKQDLGARWTSKFQLQKTLYVVGSIRVLTGDDEGYFGRIRGLDSFKLGLEGIW